MPLEKDRTQRVMYLDMEPMVLELLNIGVLDLLLMEQLNSIIGLDQGKLLPLHLLLPQVLGII